MEFTVDRSKWDTGDSEGSRLLREDTGKMCCLGFRALACGYTQDQILGVSSPGRLVIKTGDFGECWIGFASDIYTNTPACAKIMQVNDDNWLHQLVRESQLTQLFAELGDKITFTGKY